MFDLLHPDDANQRYYAPEIQYLPLSAATRLSQRNHVTPVWQEVRAELT